MNLNGTLKWLWSHYVMLTSGTCLIAHSGRTVWKEVEALKIANITVRKIGLELEGVKRNMGFFGLSLN